jgi:hypothetical protein
VRINRVEERRQSVSQFPFISDNECMNGVESDPATNLKYHAVIPILQKVETASLTKKRGKRIAQKTFLFLLSTKGIAENVKTPKKGRKEGRRKKKNETKSRS